MHILTGRISIRWLSSHVSRQLEIAAHLNSKMQGGEAPLSRSCGAVEDLSHAFHMALGSRQRNS